MYRRILAALAAWLPFALVASLLWPVLEVGSAPMPVPTRESVADSHYAAGLEAKAAKRFAAAVESFRRAVEDRPDFPEAWNELGFALRQTGRYQDALKAYDQALKRRPNFPEALEYLGEAYATLGRLDDARAILERLRPLDAARTQELGEAIQRPDKGWVRSIRATVSERSLPRRARHLD
jgi:tetratricopeptide (TPR) repeat protein